MDPKYSPSWTLFWQRQCVFFGFAQVCKWSISNDLLLQNENSTMMEEWHGLLKWSVGSKEQCECARADESCNVVLQLFVKQCGCNLSTACFNLHANFQSYKRQWLPVEIPTVSPSNFDITFPGVDAMRLPSLPQVCSFTFRGRLLWMVTWFPLKECEANPEAQCKYAQKKATVIGFPMFHKVVDKRPNS